MSISFFILFYFFFVLLVIKHCNFQLVFKRQLRSHAIHGTNVRGGIYVHIVCNFLNANILFSHDITRVSQTELKITDLVHFFLPTDKV